MDGCGSLLRRRGTLASAPGVPARPYLLTGAREDSEAATSYFRSWIKPGLDLIRP